MGHVAVVRLNLGTEMRKEKKTQRVEQLNENTVGKLKISTKHQRKKVKKGQCWRQLIAGSASKKKHTTKTKASSGSHMWRSTESQSPQYAHLHTSTHVCRESSIDAFSTSIILLFNI